MPVQLGKLPGRPRSPPVGHSGAPDRQSQIRVQIWQCGGQIQGRPERDAAQQTRQIVFGVGGSAAEQSHGGQSQGMQITAGIDGFATYLLRGQVGGRAFDGAVAGQRSAALTVPPCQSQVTDFAGTLGIQQQIRGFDVAVDKPGVGQRLQAAGGISDDGCDSFGWQRPLTLKHLLAVATSHEFEREEHSIRIGTNVVAGHDAGMSEG